MEKLKNSSAAIPARFRSVRDKTASGSYRRSRSSEPGGKSRPSFAINRDIFSVFRPESSKQAQREREEEERETVKVEKIRERLLELNHGCLSPERISDALNSKLAAGDVDKAVELLLLQQRTLAGTIVPYNPNVQMLGAENRGNVTCYLDALLFAMFANMTAFECMLKNDSFECMLENDSSDAKKKLAALVRLWVNLLRSGKLIHTDITQLIQEALATCGWKEAQLLEQQDTSEAFAFITETLQLPLLALQVDLFHQGMGDKDDHKVVHERLLNLAVPSPDPNGKGRKLEDCLEDYFNNKVVVQRDSEEEKKAYDRPNTAPRTTIRIVTEGEELKTVEHDEDNVPELLVRDPPVQNPVVQNHIAQDHLVQSPLESPTTSFANALESRPKSRHRSTSIIQRVNLENDTASANGTSESFLQRARRTGSTEVKAVTIPAWQFFRLIPWHAASSSEPSNDAEVARHFNQRPVIGICLKRYTMTEAGVPIRQNTLIDIPDKMRLPHFMGADDTGLSQEYKLVLQSVVCHRGDSLHSGHYIAFARVAPKLLTDNRRYDHDPPPDYEEAQWARFDDLALDERVTYVDDIKDSLKDEMPYLLFYQIVPMVETTAPSDGSVAEPPSYIECSTSQLGGLSPGDATIEDISRSTSSYFDSATTLVHSGPSIRFSSEADRPRLSFDDDGFATRLEADDSRRGSATVSEPAAVTITDEPSPAVTPPEESTAARLSRAAVRKLNKTGSKSRPNSQGGEGRISLTMSRLGFSRPSKEPLNVAVTEAADDVAVAEEVEAPEKEHHHLHGHHKKERSKSKSKEKEKSKQPKDSKDGKTNEPDRECVVM